MVPLKRELRASARSQLEEEKGVGPDVEEAGGGVEARDDGVELPLVDAERAVVERGAMT